ncbi:hypothetical protein [Ferrimonas futtsuensis]|uniref:hypothetical protein n=1 Tax=Ferrimonas futtsuensis TaxID=364764 RepID=UPI0004812FE9|nr:hypothetical protein [Ferrimonas futtsuensis]
MTKLPLADAILLGALALLMVGLKSLLRLKLGLAGHSMFLLVLTLLLARGLVPVRGSVLYCGLMAGLLALVLGVGKGGPLVVLKFALPALAMEAALLLLPRAPWFRIQALLVALAGLTAWLLKGGVELYLAGADASVIAAQLAWKGLGGCLFSLLGALAVPPLMSLLAHHQLLSPRRHPQ